MGWDLDAVPDPQDPTTFEQSRLDWDEPASERGRSLLDLHRRLISLRRTLPALTDPRFSSTSVRVDEENRTVLLSRGSGRDAALAALNLGEGTASLPVPDGYDVLAATLSGATVAGGRVELPPHAGALLGLGVSARPR